MNRTTDLTSGLEKLIDIGSALSVEKDTPRLLEMILLGAKTITHADGGTFYSVREDGSVHMELLHTDSLDFAMGGTTGKAIPFAPLPLYNGGHPNLNNVVTASIHKDQVINIPDAYHAEGYDFSGTRAFDEKTGYRSTSFLTVPMKGHEGHIIGVLQLLNAQAEHDNRVIPFSERAQRLATALASQAAIALTNRELIDDLKKLLEALIKLVADAIDEKSPYTGGHCRRVPVITMMLADAAAAAEHGPLADFRMSDNDRYELEIAAWLHDCGKITTPEHVVDKASKLEAIFDRIHLLEERFERLKQEAENTLLRRRLAAAEAGREPDPAWESEYREQCTRLDGELAFLRRCNLGSEFMTEDDRQRVRAIGQRRLHNADGSERTLLSENEVKNLTIAKGTLTDEEREVINHHIVTTINMLQALPFPKHLRNVPEYAGGHHEKVDGSGYPNGLSADQMSLQARMLAIADIFEALTARDRPYKRGKTLSETLRILSHMKLDGHIDPDLFDLFIREKVYEKYAAKYLDPEQIDVVDMATIPGHATR